MAYQYISCIFFVISSGNKVGLSMFIYILKRFIAFVTLIEINRAPEVYLTRLHSFFGLIYYLFVKAFDLILVQITQRT